MAKVAETQVAEAGSLGAMSTGPDPAQSEVVFKEGDSLRTMFERQLEFMRLLKDADKLPEWPIDLTSKYGQRQIKELIFAMIEEITEASFILKNRTHRFTDHTDVDFAHFREELADALAYFIEICIFSGISPVELFEEYCKKNEVVTRRARDGY
jgi:NTP pyrophosphatase (non-canonical NTP hydrolase)